MTTLSIPDMSCGHCKASIEAALAPMGIEITVDLPARTVQVQGDPDIAALIAALNDIGFQAQVIAQ